jgi:RHS repeat-associated protein
VASSTGSGAKFATSTDYIFNGDSLVATVDQQTASGNATGTAKTRYIHPDHLGSTNVVTDENDNVVQTLDYYPYGSTRVSTATSTRERRQFIGQFADDSALSYLNARYYEGSRGQFLSQDPVFLGNPKSQDLTNPQSLDSYSYANDNPISNKDPNGKCAGPLILVCVGGALGLADVYLSDVLDNEANGNQHPYTTDLSPVGTYGVGAVSGVAGFVLLPETAAYTGVSTFGTNIAEDISAGKNPDFVEAAGEAAVAVATRGIFKKSIGKLVTKELKLKSEISGGVLEEATGLIYHNSVQKAGGNGAPINNTGGTNSAFSGTLLSSSGAGGVLPRSNNPTGKDAKTGAPVYCWGYCGR